MTEGPVLQPASAELPLDPMDLGVPASFEAPEPEEQEEPQGPETDLDERAQQDFSGLMYLGYLEEQCEIAGHRFLLKTPWHEERIERGILHKPYVGTMNFEPMWELVTVATYLHSIDGRAAPEPLGPKIGPVATRLDWIKQHIYSQIVIRKIYNACLELDARERAVVEYVDGQTKS